MILSDKHGRTAALDHGDAGYNEGYLVGIDVAHHKVHEKHHYSVQDYDSEVDIAGPKYWHIKAPDTGARIHFLYTVSASLPGLLEIYEGPTTSADGTEITPYNNDRNSTNTSTLQVFYDPTVDVDGTRLCPVIIGSTGTNPAGAAGGIIHRDNELILKQNTAYLIKFSPLADDAHVSLCIDFYEVAAKDDDGI